MKKLPTSGCLTSNFHLLTFDVAIRPSFSTSVAVLFHPNSAILKAWSLCSPSLDPLVGEAEGAFFAISHVQELSISHLLLKGDSLIMVDCLQHLSFPSVLVPWRIASLILSLKSLLLAFPLSSVCKISRANKSLTHSITVWATVHSFSGHIPSFFLQHGL